jgi:hypothetical protein
VQSNSGVLKTLKTLTRFLIYASILLGATLLVELYAVVPVWLFYSVLGGWVAYLITAVAIAKDLKIAYPLSLILAILTLFVSLPQPEHHSLVEAGPSPASVTFIVGSVLQVAVILTVSSYLVLTLRVSGKGLPQDSLYA